MLSAIVIAKNEQDQLTRCLSSLKFADEIIVIDNNSTDRTAKIAKDLKAKVIKFSLQGDYSRIRNFALQQASYPWVLFVDADEVVSCELSEEIKTELSKSAFSGYFLPRLDFLWGQPLLHGDTGNIKLLRLAKKDAGFWRGKVHETWQITGPTGQLSHPLQHYPHPSLYEFLTSLNQYSDIRASELFEKQTSANIIKVVLYPVGKFINLWLLKRGFLDGTAGFVHAMSMAFYSYLVQAKLYFLHHPIRIHEIGK